MGLPSVAKRKETEIFVSIVEKIRKHIESWSDKLLSRDGKEILIKSILRAISAYALSRFKFPDGVLHEISAMIQKYWWGSMDTGFSKINWVAWSKLTLGKSFGVISFRDLDSSNAALLAKQGRRLLTIPNSFIGKVLKAKYFPNSSFLHAPLGSKPSLTWRGIMEWKSILTSALV